MNDEPISQAEADEFHRFCEEHSAKEAALPPFAKECIENSSALARSLFSRNLKLQSQLDAAIDALDSKAADHAVTLAELDAANAMIGQLRETLQIKEYDQAQSEMVIDNANARIKELEGTVNARLTTIANSDE